MKTYITSMRGVQDGEAMTVQVKLTGKPTKLHLIKASLLDSGTRGKLNDFISLLQEHAYVSIDNMPFILDVDYVTPTSFLEKVLELDYEAMSASDKKKITAFIDALKNL